MTLSLNCQTILWPIQYSGHPVCVRLVLERAALRLPLLRTRLRELPWLCLFCHRWSVFQWRACYLEAVTYVQKGVQLVTKVCYYLEFSYIYKHLIINKKALCLIAEGCTSGVHITNWVTTTYAVLFSDTDFRTIWL